MDDLVSRKAAIEAIHCDITVIGTANAETVARTIGEFVDRIKALPAAQPEIMRCKDCIKADLCACSYAERRPDE